MDELVQRLTNANTAYRSGNPIMTDAEYDRLVEDLRSQNPDHPFLHKVEPEPDGVFAGRKVRHATPMLSTEKAYSVDELKTYFDRVHAAAAALGVRRVLFRATPKLDGLAGRYDGRGHLATRGNGTEGQDISNALAKGLFIEDPSLAGDGEIVVDQKFFAENLCGLEVNGRTLTHPRNFMVGFIGADELGPHHRLAVEAQAARFVPYATLGDIQAESDIFLQRIDKFSSTLRDNCRYLTDGIVIEVLDERIREYLGATDHHHRWQIAYKTKGETAVTQVLSITWQVGRTGRVTPVLEIDPTVLSGAVIRRTTASNATLVREQHLGKGAVIRLIRSGEVIPAVEEVLKPAEHVALPENCPTCGTQLVEDGKYLQCPAGILCPDQVAGSVEHFCQTLEIKGFGEKVVASLVAAGCVQYSRILTLTQSELQGMGISPGIAANLAQELRDRCVTKIDDWRVLAAFGIRHLGRGDAKKLLSYTYLGGLPFLTEKALSEIDGFGPVTAPSIVQSIRSLLPEIQTVASLLQILHTRDKSAGETAISGAVSGKRLVFTGTFAQDDRKAIEAQAEKLGAKVQSSVNAKTDFLVVADKPGAKKLQAAQQLGTKILSESEYFSMIG